MKIENFKDIYLKVLCCAPYLIGFISYVIINVQDVSGVLDALGFIFFSAIALGVSALGTFISVKLVQTSTEYFGLPQNYITITILCIIMSFLSVIILRGIIANVFPPDVSKSRTPFFF